LKYCFFVLSVVFYVYTSVKFANKLYDFRVGMNKRTIGLFK